MLVHFAQCPPVVTSCKTVVQFWSIQDIDNDTIHQSCSDFLSFMYSCVCVFSSIKYNQICVFVQ